MENNINEEDYMPDDVKQADVTTQYAFVLRAYSDSLVAEKKAEEAAVAAKRTRRFLQNEADKFMKAFSKSTEESYTVVATEKKPSATPAINNQTEKNSSVEEFKQEPAKKGERPDNESWTISAIRAFDKIDRPGTNEDVCDYYGVSGKEDRKAVRSAIKYVRDLGKNIIGIAYYSAPTLDGKRYRKVYMNVIPRFYENEDPATNKLKPRYQRLMEAEVEAKGWITFEELQRRGGTVINEN